VQVTLYRVLQQYRALRGPKHLGLYVCSW
jgi:hypothetical protein